MYRLALDGQEYAAHTLTDRPGLVFADEAGSIVRDKTLARRLSATVWMYDNLLNDPNKPPAASGEQRTRILLETQRDLRVYEIVQQGLARAMVDATAYAVTGGSLTGPIAGMPIRVLRDQLTTVYGLLSLEARLGVADANSGYTKILFLTQGMTSQAIDVPTAERALGLYFKAYVLDLAYGQLLTALLPKTGQALIQQALDASAGEFMSLVQPGPGLVKWSDIYAINAHLLDLSTNYAPLISYHSSHSAALRAVAEWDAAIDRAAMAAAMGCGPGDIELSPAYPGLPGWLVDAASLPITLSGLSTQPNGNLYVFGDFKQWTRVPSGMLLTALGSTRSLDLTFLSAEDYRYRVKLAVRSGEASVDLSTFGVRETIWLLPRQVAARARGVAVREIAGTEPARRTWQIENLRVVLRKTDRLSGLLSLQLADGTVKTLQRQHFQSDSATYAALGLRQGESLGVGSPLLPRPVAAFRLTSPGPLVVIVGYEGLECHDYRLFLVTNTEVRTLSNVMEPDFAVCST